MASIDGIEKSDVTPFDAIMVGAAALTRMAYVLDGCHRAMRECARKDPTFNESRDNHHAMLMDTAKAIDAAMQEIGDYINNCDATDSLTEPATDTAFAMMRLLLA